LSEKRGEIQRDGGGEVRICDKMQRELKQGEKMERRKAAKLIFSGRRFVCASHIVFWVGMQSFKSLN